MNANETTSIPCKAGEHRLWVYFGLSYAAWLTLPRVMMHAMPDEWQEKMAKLLEEWDETWCNMPDLGTRVQTTKAGKLCAVPDYLKSYRHPDRDALSTMRTARSSESS